MEYNNLTTENGSAELAERAKIAKKTHFYVFFVVQSVSTLNFLFAEIRGNSRLKNMQEKEPRMEMERFWILNFGFS